MLGVEWGPRSCRMVCLQNNEEQIPVVQGAVALALPESEEESIRMVRQCLETRGWTGLRAALSLEDPHLHLRRLELPKMPEEDLREAIRWQMRDIAEGSIEDYVIQRSILEEVASELPRLIVLGFAMKRDSRAVEAGLDPVFMEPLPVAFASAIERLYRTDNGEWRAGLWVGETSSTLIVVGRGKLHFVKTLPAFEEGSLGKAAVEVQNALDAFFILYKADKVERIFLAQGPKPMAGLAEYLTKNVGIPTESFNPLSGIQVSPEAKKIMEAVPSAFTIALEMAQVTL